MQPIRYTFPACCAAAASGAMRMARARMTMSFMVLRHMVISSRRLLACLEPATRSGSENLLQHHFLREPAMKMRTAYAYLQAAALFSLVGVKPRFMTANAMYASERIWQTFYSVTPNPESTLPAR